MRNYSLYDWPSFRNVGFLSSLTSLKIYSKDSWPVFSELKYSSSLEELSIFSSASIYFDYQIIDSISDIKKLKYIHIAISGKDSFWPDLAPLGKLNFLRVLEISSDGYFYNICGFDELDQLEKIIINSVVEEKISKNFISQIKIFCPDCLVEINEGWHEELW
jgi:hypothetical protein